jgi:hypothetical protein
LKLLSPSAFLRHISNLKLPVLRGRPRAATAAITAVLAVVECVLGVALLVRIFPDRVFPLCLGLLVVFATVTILSPSMGRSADCGCFGNILILTPSQSVLLNALSAASIVAAWRFPVGFGVTPLVQKTILMVSVAFFTGIAAASMWSSVKFGQDLLDTSPLKPRRRWNPEWLEGFRDYSNRHSLLVALLSPDCLVCKAWIEPLNKLARRPGMPQLIAGMAGETKAIGAFRREFNIKFPLLPVRATTMVRLVHAYPTLVTVEDGKITSVNVGQLPAELLRQLRHPSPCAPGLTPDAASTEALEALSRP